MNLAAKAIRTEDAFAHWQVQREGDPSKSPLGIVGEPRNPWIYLDSHVFSGVWNIHEYTVAGDLEQVAMILYIIY